MAEVLVKININNLLKKYDISLRELSRLTYIRHATLSELANNKRQRIQLDHIKRICEALNIKDIQEVISIESIEEDE